MRTRKYIFIAVPLIFLTVICVGQQTKVPYGNNPAAGKYYSVRGIKIYTEIYGKGKPLLLIHGNGGSMNAFAFNIPYLSKKYKVIARYMAPVSSRSSPRCFRPSPTNN